VRLLPNRLGPKLNLSLLVFLLLLGGATAFLLIIGFRSSQNDATRRSSDALEQQAKDTLGLLAQTQASFGEAQLESTAGLGQQAAHYFVDAAPANTAPPFDASRLARTDSGQLTDPAPNRTSSVMIPAGVPVSDAVLRDARDSATLDTLFPAILAGFSGDTRSPNFEAIAVYFNSVTGFTRYYPPVPASRFPASADPRAMVAQAGPDANPAHRTVWTQPYTDASGRGQVITALVPVYQRDEYRGVIGMDLPLDRLATQVDQLKPSANGYAFYLDGSGGIFRTESYDVVRAAMDDPSNTGFASVVSAMQANRSDVLRADLGGQEVFVAFAPIQGVGGSLALVTPISDVTAQAALVSNDIDTQGNRTIAFVVATMVAFFFVALIAAAWLYQRVFLRPIEALVDATRSVAAGEYATRIPVRSGDELGLLADSFNGMTSQLAASRQMLENRNRELESEVAERRRMADELREREQQYRGVFDATTDGLMISTLEGKIVEVNDAAARMHGYTREEFLALPPGSHVHPDSRPLRDEYFAALQNGTSYRGRAVNVRKDGTTFPIDFHGTRFTYNGQPHGLGVIRDISDQVAAERALAHRASISALGAEVGAALTSAVPLRDTLQRCTEAAVRNLDAVQARIWTLDREMVVFELQASAGLDPGINDEFRRVPVLPDDVAGRPVIVDDMLNDPRLNSVDRERARRDGLVAMARYPLVVDADVVGLMVVFTRERLTELTMDALPSIAGAIAVAIKRDEAEREVREAQQLLEQRVVERTRELSALLDVSHTVASTLDLKRLLGLVLDQLQSVAGYTGCSILTVDGESLVITDSRGPRAEETAATIGMRFPLAVMRPFWEQIQRGETISIGDVRGESEDANTYRFMIGRFAETPAFDFVRSMIMVPLGWKDSVIGMLTLTHETPHYYDEGQRRLVAGIATQAAVAIENARLYEQAEERTRELSTLLDVSSKVASTLALEPLLDLILDQVQAVAPYDRAAFMLLDEGDLVVRAVTSRPGLDEGPLRDQLGLRLPAARSTLWNAISESRIVIAPDVRDDSPEAEAYRAAVGDYINTIFAHIRGWMGVPVISKDRVIGMLALSSEERDRYRPRHGELARAIASQAAVAVENARLFEETQRRTSELSALLSVSQRVAAKLEVGPLISALLEQLRTVIEYNAASILTRDGDEIAILDVFNRVDGTVAPRAGLRFRAEGAIWEAMERRESVVVRDVRSDERWARLFRGGVGPLLETSFAHVVAWVSVPLVAQDRVIGALTIANPEAGYFIPERLRLIQGIANQAAVAMENARLFEETQQRAREMSALLSVSQSVGAKLELGPLLSVLDEQVHSILDFHGMSVLAREDDELVLLDVTGAAWGSVDAPRTRLRFPAAGPIWEEMEAGRSIVIGDVLAEDDLWASQYRQTVASLPEIRGFAGIRAWMALPLTAKDQVIGMLTISSKEPEFFSPARERVMRGIASQVAVAIDNARLFEETQQRTAELSALLDVSHDITATLDRGELASRVLDQMQKIVSYAGASVVIIDGDMLEVLDSRTPGGAMLKGARFPLHRAEGLQEWMATLQPAIVDNVHTSDHPVAVAYRTAIGDLASTPAFSGLRSWMAIPLAANDQAIGIVTMSRTEEGAFTERHARLARAVADQAAVAIDNARLFEETRQRTTELTTLLDVSHDVATTLDTTVLVGLILDQLKQIIHYTGSSVSILLDDRYVEIVDSRGAGAEQTKNMRIPAERAPLLWRQATSLQPVVIPDIRDPDDPLARDYIAAIGPAIDLPAFRDIRSWMAIPLAPKDKAIGLLSMSHTTPNYFTERHGRIARAIADQAALALDNARLFEETQQRAREMGALLDVTRGVASTLDLRAVAALILEHLKSIVGFSNATLSIIDGSEFRMLETNGPLPRSWLARIRVPVNVVEPRLEGNAAGRGPGSGETSIIDDIWGDSYAAQAFQEAATHSAAAAGVTLEPLEWVHSYMGVPIVTKGRIVGLLSLQHEQAGFYTQAHERLARAVADQAAVAIENARLFEETKRRARETEALFRADDELFRTLNIDAVFEALVGVMVDVLRVDKCMVSSIDDDEGRYTVRASRNIAPSSLELMMRIRRRRPRRELGTITGPIINEDAVAALPDMTPVFLAEGIRSTMDIPIRTSTGLRAVFSCAYTGTHEYTLDEQRLFQALAERAAVALDNAELYERSQQVASLEERQRLARELHDSVSQALYGIALGARTARTLLDRDPSKATQPVEYVLQLAEAGLAEMRALIFELRPESLESEGLVAAIGKHVAATQARYGIEVGSDMCDEPDAPLDVKEAVYRIAQEALHNVVKHARATHVDVRLSCTPSEIAIEIADNGAGFDPDGAFPGHMGLRSMRERAARAGGALDIASAPGSGTTITGRIALPPSDTVVPHI
jgi:PAS domain S-box-containing protein